jgi:hypothetical protein
LPLPILIAAGLFVWQPGGATPAPHPASPDAAIAHAEAVDRYQALADSRARDYDRAQDIRPAQLLALLDVAERTGYSLGQLLATGEHESAHTWNDFVRPPLGGGRVGSAAGVWQFQPKTFERVIHRHGEELLALTEADPETGRMRLDLGFGPFCDRHVRLVIQDTIDGLRDAADQELRLLRHNFTVLAIAKYLLSMDSGARDPVEDYLFHFLGPGQGRRILTLAAGDARDTHAVKPPPPPTTTPLGQGSASPAAAQRGDRLPPRPRLLLELAPRGYKLAARGTAPLDTRPLDARPLAAVRTPLGSPSRGLPAAAPSLSPAPAWPAPHGYEHDSPVVTGNLGMFYRDGAGRSDPYTWAEFLAHIARRVRADEQPGLVRAKYGVGFELAGGDMPHWAFDPDRPGETLSLRLDDGSTLAMPKARLTRPLDARETRDYQRRLAALIRLGEAEPTTLLSDAAATAFHRLGLLAAGDTGPDGARAGLPATLGADMGPGLGIGLSTETGPVRDALHAFRALVDKAPPDDPAHADLLLPAERVALELYAARIERFVAARQAEAARRAGDEG